VPGWLAGLSVSLWQMRPALQAEAEANTNANQVRDERDAKDVVLEALAGGADGVVQRRPEFTFHGRFP
jgi:hypothetical protein